MLKHSESASRMFAKEMQTLRDEHGIKAQLHAYVAFTQTIQWLRKHGHLKVTMSAIDHVLSVRIKVKTFVEPKK